MPHRKRKSARALINTLEQSPFDLNAWSDLAETLRIQQDLLSVKSVVIILEALKKVDFNAADKKNIPMPSPTATALFIRLARSYNNPDLLQRVGELFAHEWNLPTVASAFFERSDNLNGLGLEGESMANNLAYAEGLAKTKVLEFTQDLSEEAPAELSEPSWLQPFAKPDLNVILKKSGTCFVPGVSKLAKTSPPQVDSSGQELAVNDSKALVAEAIVALNQRDLPSAQALLEKASLQPLEARPMWQAWSTYGQVSYENCRFGEMEKGYRKAIDYEPTIIASYFNLGLALQLNGRFDEAERCYLLADKIQPDNPRVWSNLGSLYFQTEQITRAEAAFRHSLKIDPSYARAWDNLAATLQAQNRPVEAKQACERALQLRPNFPETHFKMGTVYFHEEDLVKAQHAFTKSAVLPALAAASNCFLTMIYARQQDFDSAEQTITKAQELRANPNMLSTAWSDLGRAYAQNGQLLQAAGNFQEATALMPEEADLWSQLADAYAAAGHRQAAQQIYLKAESLRAEAGGGRQAGDPDAPDLPDRGSRRSEVMLMGTVRGGNLPRTHQGLAIYREQNLAERSQASRIVMRRPSSFESPDLKKHGDQLRAG